MAGAGLPNAGLAADGSNESVAISGAQGRAEQNILDPGDIQDRIAEMRDRSAGWRDEWRSRRHSDLQWRRRVRRRLAEAGGFGGAVAAGP